jgi:hypothetical protein
MKKSHEGGYVRSSSVDARLRRIDQQLFDHKAANQEHKKTLKERYAFNMPLASAKTTDRF